MIQLPEFYLVMDTETLGLDPRIHQISEFAGVLLEASSLREVSCYQSYIRPESPVFWEKGALKTTGISIDKLYTEGKPSLCVWSGMMKWLNGECNDTFHIQTVTMNKVFDMPRIQNELLKHGFDQPWNYGHKWDLMDMARAYAIDSYGYSLEAMLEYFGVPRVGAHGALADARMTAEVFRRFQAIRDRIQDIMKLGPMEAYLNKCRGLA